MTTQFDLISELQQYGVDKGRVRLLPQHPDADAIAYLDVYRDERLRERLAAVVEDERRPLVYVVQAASVSNDLKLRLEQVRQLSAQLACRGSVAYLCLVEFGQITLYPCGLTTTETNDAPLVVVLAESEGAGELFQKLLQGQAHTIQGQDGARLFTPDQVGQVLRKILLDVCRRLMDTRAFGTTSVGVASTQVLALVGRAVFTRFLADRGIINPESFAVLYERFGGPEAAFDTVESSAVTCRWLDSTFNGEFLQLVSNHEYEPFFEQVVTTNSRALLPLGQIMRKQTIPGMTPLWEMVDFAHVPAGLLSEVYESFVAAYDGVKRKNDSVYYTPQHVADMVVAQSFQGLPEQLRHQAVVADPAAGAGIFLVLSLRQLVEETWKATGVRPNATQIRQILYNQVRGFDINPHALLLSALSLYLTVIELAPEERQHLAFERSLIDTVLFNVGENFGPEFGTLSDALPGEPFGKFDLVVGNPPWSRWRKNADALNRRATALAKAVIRERLPEEQEPLDYKNPGSYPDIPFLWRAMQLAKPGGLIALLLHGRLLFGEGTRPTRVWLARTLRIHGIVNASSFSDETKLWGVKAPFLMLFARNTVPDPQEQFWFLSPYLEHTLAGRGKIRLDPQQAHALQHQELADQPDLLRPLYRGTTLDLEIIRALDSRLDQPLEALWPVPVEGKSRRDKRSRLDHPPIRVPSKSMEWLRLKQYWINKEFPKISGAMGYISGNQEKETKALLALGGKDFTPTTARSTGRGYLVESDALPPFEHQCLEKPRTPKAYRPPLVLVGEARKKSSSDLTVRLALGETPIIFNGSFTGISTANSPEPEAVAAYLLILLSSDLATYYWLMTSSMFGVSRRKLDCNDVYDLPLPDFFSLSEQQKRDVNEIGQQMQRGDAVIKISQRLNSFVFDLYGLTKWDQQVISDTLKTQLPFKEVSMKAEQRPSTKEKLEFLLELQKLVGDMFKQLDSRAEVIEQESLNSAWVYYSVRKVDDDSGQLTGFLASEIKFMAEAIADAQGATVIRHVVQPGRHVAIAILAQSRYFTITRARLLSGEVVRLMSQQI